jgi:hypothetical protein
MQDKTTYYVIKPTLHNKVKVSFGEALALTDKQAQPLLHGGFIGTHQPSAVRIGELVAEVEQLHASLASLKTKNTVQEKPKEGVKETQKHKESNA